MYYRADDDGVPHEWVKVMKEAIKSTAPFFSARRMTKEYAERFLRRGPEISNRKNPAGGGISLAEPAGNKIADTT